MLCLVLDMLDSRYLGDTNKAAGNTELNLEIYYNKLYKHFCSQVRNLRSGCQGLGDGRNKERLVKEYKFSALR